jgi:hypothetical protein
MNLKRKFKVMSMMGLAILGSVCYSAEKQSEWSLRPIKGTVEGWSEGANWKHADGNPLKENGATWTLGFQAGDDPALGDPIVPMAAGSANNGYTKVWEGGKAGESFSYDNNSLGVGTQCAPGIGAAAVISFSPGEGGEYSFDLKGQLKTQIPEAGATRLCFFTMDAEGKNAKLLPPLQETEIKVGSGKAVDWKKTVKLLAGERLCIRIQTHNPGPGKGGWTSFAIEHFTVIRK